MNPVNASARVAVVAYSSLGDGLIYLLIAENLRLNGYRVSYFGNVGHQLSAWLPQMDIHPYPAIDEFDARLADFDLVVMSPPQDLRARMNPERTDAMRRKWLLICQNAPADWRFNLAEAKRDHLAPEIYAAVEPLLDCGGSIRYRKFDRESVVDITLDYLRSRMGLARLERSVVVNPPAGLEHRRHHRRIVVSPDSAGPEKKDWSPSAFLKLCRRLRAQAWDPKIVVAPGNHPRWSSLPGNDFDTPLFHDVGALAAYLFESGALIANDSGNGHLASFLGIPVVTIYRKKNPAFHWRPDWGPTRVVCPPITLPGPRGSIWKPFVTPGAVIAALRSLA